MKRVLILSFQVVFAISLAAQSQGKIVFEEKMDMHRRIPPERAEMKEMIPQFRANTFELYFTEDASVYKAAEENQTDEVTASQGGAQIRMRMTPPRREVYKSLASDKMVDEREFMTKMFLIKGTAAPYKWKISDGQKKIMDYVCMQATFRDSVSSYTAWFTPQIPVSNGPAEFGGLPGMILEININDGERVITATGVTEKAVDPEMLEEPTRGKEVTQEEFREIMHEKMKEMQQTHGGGPMIMIHRN